MRLGSRAARLDDASNVVSLRAGQDSARIHPDIGAVRGVMVAVAASAVFWGGVFAVIWWFVLRH